MECTLNVVLATGISCSYVGLIYAFDYNGSDRNNPRSIKRRFLGALMSDLLGITATYMAIGRYHRDPFGVMGIHRRAIFSAAFIPAILTSVFYLGDWVMAWVDGHLSELFGLLQWRDNLTKLTWIRNRIMAPVTEELAFRACTATLMLQCLSTTATVFIAPLPFALSHLHHVFDDMKRGRTREQAVPQRVFQTSYSYLFGAYATFLFVRVGNIIAPIVCHSICNNMGLPSFEYIDSYPKRSTRILLWISYLGGFFAWMLLLMPLTDPALYS
ncbi:unnamed protein product [Anisakis simplex]|uniref:CAAX prenyl protease 2 n=1 Tax=Anisakis simplex TaxID=6269 RepID=A0A0M3K5Q9_ANISI|nr:unnamed protein product [Anisakis simplex]